MDFRVAERRDDEKFEMDETATNFTATDFVTEKVMNRFPDGALEQVTVLVTATIQRSNREPVGSG